MFSCSVENPFQVSFLLYFSYIPRIFFLSPNGDVRSDIYNKGGNPSYKYFYSNPTAIVASMKKAVSAPIPAKEDL